MAAPIKPWEAGAVNLRSDKDVSGLSIQSTSKLPDINVNTLSSMPPPVPLRPANILPRRTTNTPGMIGGSQVYRGYPSTGGYGGNYGTYGNYGGYGNYGMYGYGGYGGAYPSYPYGLQNASDANNRIVALAEESARPAFESIESVVRAFGSVSYMLESTLGALHASFRAALGVADHLSHLRNILSALSIFRLLQWCLSQLRRLFGLRHSGTSASLGGCWGEAVHTSSEVAGSAATPSGSSQWPLRAFIGVIISGSYLAWKLLSYVMGPGGSGPLDPFKGEENEPWVQGKDVGCQLAIGIHSFTAATKQELSICAGDRLIIAPGNRQPVDGRDWLLAAHLRPSTAAKAGLIPANYVRMVERRPRVASSWAPVGGLQHLHSMAGTSQPAPVAPAAPLMMAGSPQQQQLAPDQLPPLVPNPSIPVAGAPLLPTASTSGDNSPDIVASPPDSTVLSNMPKPSGSPKAGSDSSEVHSIGKGGGGGQGH